MKDSLGKTIADPYSYGKGPAKTIEKYLAKDHAIMQSPTGLKTAVIKAMMHKLEAKGWKRVN